ncbi:CHAT domain-containing protein [Vibrio gigantis]|uniref:CHAT domain-containing protein n=1 Tax=Vibrio gigantis TaxID=296199 RepID=A0A5M9NPE1_9VIBR|nr:CHAT domain-containing protein [Vibrio gigantis]KAA8672319.1 CHAT domain-containing protein [Vibrio gigantis]
MGFYSLQTKQAIEYSAMQDLQLRCLVTRKWFDLTETAKQLIKSKDAKSIAKAERLLSKALKIALKEPLARASTCHDLGVLHFSYHTELPGGTYHNLNKAIQYFKRAIDTPQRQVIPEKHASSLSQLAVVYRRAAHDYLWPDKDLDCIEKAKALHIQAIDLLINSEIPKVIRDGQLSIIHFNLASVLFDQGLNQKACASQAKSVELYLGYLNYSLPPFMNVMAPEQGLGLSFARLMHFSDSPKHKELCETILDIAPRFGVDPIKIMTINPEVDIARPEQQIDYLLRTAKAKPSPDNLKQLFKKQYELMENRRTCKSDAEADVLASLVQRTCSGLARILMEQEDLTAAFKLLENCSALRFCESANKHWQVPEKKVCLPLRSDLLQMGSTYYNLNELALMLEHLSAEDAEAALTEVFERSQKDSIIEEVGESTYFYKPALYPAVLKGAIDDKDSIAFLRQKSNDCLTDFLKIESLIDELDPAFLKRRNSDYSVQIEHFEEALSKNPNLTLVRIDIESNYDDVLILVAMMNAGKLVVTGHSVSLPRNLVNDIGAYVKGNADGLRTWVLDFINWREILPDDCKRLGLLTSFFASQIPWAATGIEGEELYTLVDEINWLPTVLYLCNHVTHFSERSGTRCINGGETRFHNVANKHASGLMTDVQKDDFVEVVSTSEVISYYGHCAHELPNRPYLKTKHFDMNDVELVNQVAGMERVEFWACQSGSNIPLSIFSIPVNEAFGFDMRMIEWGAVSSIGSLWALPDIVTAHIKSHYDQLLNSGYSPSKALLAAQRWWVSQGAKAELNKMRELGLSPYLNTLGCNETLAGLLGPMKTKESRNEDELKRAERLFLHPSSWAGLRFCGIAEQINQAVYLDKVDLTVDEVNQLKSSLAKQKLKSGFINYV